MVTFRITARVLLQQFYKQQRQYPEEEKIRLIQTGRCKTYKRRHQSCTQDIKICDAAIGIRIDQVLVGHCRSSHNFLLHGTVSLLSQPWLCRWRDRQMSPDVVIQIVGCILDKFVGHVRFVSSLGAGIIYLNEVSLTSSY